MQTWSLTRLIQLDCSVESKFSHLVGSRSAAMLFAMFLTCQRRSGHFHTSSCPVTSGANTKLWSSSMSLPMGGSCSSQEIPHLTLTQPWSPRRKQGQLMLSIPQFQPDLHQLAPWLASNSHTVYSGHWHFQDLFQGLTMVSLALLDTISPAAAECVWKTGEKNVVHQYRVA